MATGINRIDSAHLVVLPVHIRQKLPRSAKDGIVFSPLMSDTYFAIPGLYDG